MKLFLRKKVKQNYMYIHACKRIEIENFQINDPGTYTVDHYIQQIHIHVQSNLNYSNPFGQLQNLSVQISKQMIKGLYSMYG